MSRCPACGGLLRAASALRCPFCGVSLPASGTRTAAAFTPTLDPDAVHDVEAWVRIGDARFAPDHLFAARFRIVSVFGRGAIGEVYRADDLRLGQPVAPKLLTKLGATVPERCRRAYRRSDRRGRLTASPGRSP